MACVDVLHIGDEQTSIELEITECAPDGSTQIVDITNANTLTIRLQKSDKAKTTIDKPCTIYDGGINGDGTDGITQYLTEAGLVDVKGKWKAQAIVVFPDGGKFHSDIVEINVAANLKEPL